MQTTQTPPDSPAQNIRQTGPEPGVASARLLAGLKRQHEDCRVNRERWQILRAIAEGGAAADSVKGKLLINPDGVGKAVAKDRADAAPLVNKIGPIIARFVTQLFVDAPKVEGTKKPWLQDFLDHGARLPGDSDQRASLEQFLDMAMFSALAEGGAIAQVDTRTASGSRFLSGQAQAGELDPYVVLLNREAMWDWEMGENGLQACKLHRFSTYRAGLLDAPMPEHIFTIYERDGDRVLGSQYRVRKVRKRLDEVIEPKPFIDSVIDPKDVTIEATELSDGTRLERVEIFNQAGRYEFPIILLSLPGFLCIGEQLMGLQKEHFNNRASMNWAINRANWAMPYIIGGDEDPFQDKRVKAGDGRYLWFPGDSGYQVGSLAVNSPAIPASAEKERGISNDIYETLQQMAYLASQSGAAISRSEESRIKDKELEHVLLHRHGTILKEFAKKIVVCAGIAANDPTPADQYEVDGFEKFSTNGLLSYLPLYMGLAQIGGVPVPAFKRMQLKDMARLYGTTLDRPSEEIDEVVAAVDAMSDDEVMKAGMPPEMAQPEPGQEGGEG
jgi:hypothetical protein